MDSTTEFKFLNQNLAISFNPYQEGEYLIIQTYPYPCKHTLRVCQRTFDYKSARSSCELENMAHDYSCFDLRIFHNQKLWTVDFMGEAEEISSEQDWKINQDYFEANNDENIDGEIVICRCSYPYFSSLRTFINRYGESGEYWQPITCLEEDNGRDINNCPNCNYTLIELDDDDDDEEESTPIVCRGCQNYHGQVYGSNLLVCAIHPHGWDGENCPDFEAD
ncbi:MAG: hypothetical protein ACIWVG_31730 [Gloeotrichia echinulata HAB0833]